MVNLQHRCVGCGHARDRMIAEGLLKIVCPNCYRVLKLTEFGMRQGLTLGEALVGVLAIFVIWEIVNSA